MAKLSRLLLIFGSLFFSFDLPAQPKYEFRGVWIATVSNIDWPAAGNFNVDNQKAEFIRILDLHRSNGMNAVIAQIRPATDAFYPSQYEPWSEWLTGRQGQPPSPYYDPLEFMITETHKRGMEFHAWMNPYRAEFSIGRSSIAPTHVTRVKPQWFVQYGGKRYFDPAHKEVQEFVTNVVRDVVSRYDVDAIHFDDYFYPYPVARVEFPDESSYRRSGTRLSKFDWRRSNVDSIIVKLSAAIKQEKRHVKFGISPFGVWRNADKDPRGSNTTGALSNYDDLYANILLWLEKGWIDYVAPQLYWEIGHKIAPFEHLLNWWANNSYRKHLYIGHGIYRALEQGGAWKSKNQIPSQIKALRIYEEVHGSAYYSSKSFNKNPIGWNDSLKLNYYRYPALVPPMPWLDTTKPEKPAVERLADGTIKILTNPDDGHRLIIVYCATNGKVDINDPTSIVKMIPMPEADVRFTSKQCRQFGFTTVSRNSIESEPVLLR
jgi:uncharacterized lipoprotein YddW (UPF0748 family)